MRAAFLALALPLQLLAAAPPPAQPRTVCTITVNSADEKEAFRRRLPPGQYRFEELVDTAGGDWLREACTRRAQCDVLIVSGHFNAGEAFYSDDLAKDESLNVDALERASCSASCPGVFARLKEVYLFGCESLNPDATKYSSSHGESGRDRMRRIFAGVPVIYGFSSSAPLGPTAAMLINRHFDSGARGIGSGRADAGLLRAFSRNHMVATSGVGANPGENDYRTKVCGFFDQRLSQAQKLSRVHGLMRADMAQAREFFERIEGLLGSVSADEQAAPDFALALARVSADDAARASFLAATRATPAATLRARMIAMAGTLGWLTPAQQRGELDAMFDDILSGARAGFAEVDLACSLPEARDAEGRFARATPSPSGPGAAGANAVLACLGNAAARRRTLAALASADDRDVQAAQAYLRHRPVSDAAELRAMARQIARMPATSAHARALDALGRHRIEDREIVDGLTRSFAATTSIAVQRAIAEIFLRSDPRPVARPDLAEVLMRNRIKSRDAEDVIDVVIRRLQAPA